MPSATGANSIKLREEKQDLALGLQQDHCLGLVQLHEDSALVLGRLKQLQEDEREWEDKKWEMQLQIDELVEEKRLWELREITLELAKKEGG